ncbi:MAG: hypothetical protein JWM81_77 [Candidatus Saccharibacteria bacterium]|nr:hypothetical protein [Candidatus Saccharibacteria bacterium]
MIDDFKPVRPRKKSLEAQTNTPSKVETPKSTPESFKTPEQVAASDAVPAVEETQLSSPQPVQFDAPEPVKSDAKKSFASRLKLTWPPSKKEALVMLAVIVVVGSGLGGFILTRQGPAPVAAVPKTIAKKVAPPAPTTVASTLSGLQVDPSLNARPVTAVMIENSTDARPQSGLGQASVVFEAIAEGGITRFLTLFQDTTPTDLGPVRSVRPYYLEWATSFDAPIAHVGGSPEALADIKTWGAKDLDQFFNAGAYHRITSRAAPHNVYTSLDNLLQLSASKGFTKSTFTGFPRKADQPTKVAPTEKSINFAISGPDYNAHYDYDATSNSYLRSEGGAPHMDASTNTQIRAKVVIGLVIPYAIQSDGKHSEYTTAGASGQAYVFQDGKLTIGTWSKATRTSQFVFTDAAGKVIALNAGPTWLTAVSAANKITAAP